MVHVNAHSSSPPAPKPSPLPTTARTTIKRPRQRRPCPTLLGRAPALCGRSPLTLKGPQPWGVSPFLEGPQPCGGVPRRLRRTPALSRRPPFSLKGPQPERWGWGGVGRVLRSLRGPWACSPWPSFRSGTSARGGGGGRREGVAVFERPVRVLPLPPFVKGPQREAVGVGWGSGGWAVAEPGGALGPFLVRGLPATNRPIGVPARPCPISPLCFEGTSAPGGGELGRCYGL